MALSYAQLFADLGKLIKHYDLQYADGNNLAADLDEILDEFQDEGTIASRNDAIDGLSGAFAGWESEYASRRATLADYALRRLQDRASVLVELGAVSTGRDEIISRLIDAMAIASESVNASAVSLGSSTAVSGNTGNGTIVTTKTLDGINSPGSLSGVSFPANRRYAGLDTELASPSDTMAFECVADSYADGVTEGSEVFRWTGGPVNSTHGLESEGSGDLGAIIGLHGAGILSNLDFEDFATADTPDSWTIDAGTAGTHINEQGSGSNVYHGSKSLNFLGDGAQASIQVSQAPPSGSLKGGQAYAVTVRYKADATIAAGQFTVQFEGTGYTASSTERVQIAAGSLATSWTLQSFIVVMPDNLPSDMKLVVKWTGTPTNTKNLWIDDLAFGPVQYGAGVGAVVVRGATPFVRGDKFTVAISNTEGVIQRFFRRVFGYQLPSDSGGTETVADSLAS